MASPRGAAAFLDTIVRDEVHGRDRRHEEMKEATPSKYFQEEQPFLQKTYNASFPPFKFY